MINKITNIDDLRAERTRLRQKKYELEDAMRNDFALIKESLKPGNIIRNGLGGLAKTTGFADNDFLGTSLTMGINFLVSKVLLRRSGLAKKLIMTWLLRRYGVDFMNKNSDDIISVVKNVIGKFIRNKKHKEPFDIYDGGTVADNF